jgi:hypothetical protein
MSTHQTPNNARAALGRRLTVLLALSNLLVLILYVSGWTHEAPPQEPRLSGKERAVRKGFAPPNEPVEFASLKVKGRAAGLGEKFEGEGDWLRGVTLSIRNRADQPIVWARLDLTFPETAATGPVMLHQIFLGSRPDLPQPPGVAPLRLMPKETLEVPLAAEYEQIKTLIELRHASVELVRQLDLHLGEVLYEDGTLWSGGQLFKRNPDPGGQRKWLRLSDGPQPPAGR